jgi:hypothetical protein
MEMRTRDEWSAALQAIHTEWSAALAVFDRAFHAQDRPAMPLASAAFREVEARRVALMQEGLRRGWL